MFCKGTGCLNEPDDQGDGLCKDCRKRLAEETKRRAEFEARQAAILAECENSGQFMSVHAPVNLTGNTGQRERSPEELEAKREADAKKKKRREKNRKERLASQPKGNSENRPDGGGNSKKSRQKAKKCHHGSDHYRGNQAKGTAVKKSDVRQGKRKANQDKKQKKAKK